MDEPGRVLGEALAEWLHAFVASAPWHGWDGMSGDLDGYTKNNPKKDKT